MSRPAPAAQGGQDILGAPVSKTNVMSSIYDAYTPDLPQGWVNDTAHSDRINSPFANTDLAFNRSTYSNAPRAYMQDTSPANKSSADFQYGVFCWPFLPGPKDGPIPYSPGERYTDNQIPYSSDEHYNNNSIPHSSGGRNISAPIPSSSGEHTINTPFLYTPDEHYVHTQIPHYSGEPNLNTPLPYSSGEHNSSTPFPYPSDQHYINTSIPYPSGERNIKAPTNLNASFDLNALLESDTINNEILTDENFGFPALSGSGPNRLPDLNIGQRNDAQNGYDSFNSILDEADDPFSNFFDEYNGSTSQSYENEVNLHNPVSGAPFPSKYVNGRSDEAHVYQDDTQPALPLTEKRRRPPTKSSHNNSTPIAGVKRPRTPSETVPQKKPRLLEGAVAATIADGESLTAEATNIEPTTATVHSTRSKTRATAKRSVPKKPGSQKDETVEEEEPKPPGQLPKEPVARKQKTARSLGQQQKTRAELEKEMGENITISGTLDLGLSVNGVSWKNPAQDNTIPTTQEEVKKLLQDVIDAMKNNIGCREQSTQSQFQNRWGDGAQHFSHEEFSMAAREVLNIVINIHRNGWTKPIYDKAVRDVIAKTKNYTFERRMDTLIDLLRVSKTCCNDIMKGERVYTIIGNPSLFIDRTRSNANSNRNKARHIKLGNEIEKAQRSQTENAQNNQTKKPQRRKRSRSDEDDDNNEGQGNTNADPTTTTSSSTDAATATTSNTNTRPKKSRRTKSTTTATTPSRGN